MDGKTGANRSRKPRARDGMYNLTECAYPVGAADKKQSFSRTERLAMDVETGANRSRKPRARDRMYNLTECAYPVGAADKKHRLRT